MLYTVAHTPTALPLYLLPVLCRPSTRCHVRPPRGVADRAYTPRRWTPRPSAPSGGTVTHVSAVPVRRHHRRNGDTRGSQEVAGADPVTAPPEMGIFANDSCSVSAHDPINVHVAPSTTATYFSSLASRAAAATPGLPSTVGRVPRHCHVHVVGTGLPSQTRRMNPSRRRRRQLRPHPC